MFSLLRRAARYRLNVFHILAVVALAVIFVMITPFVLVQYILPPPFHTVYAESATQFDGDSVLSAMSFSDIPPKFEFEDEDELYGLWNRSYTAMTGNVTISLAGTRYYPDRKNEFWLYIGNESGELLQLKRDQFKLQFARRGKDATIPVKRLKSLSLDLASEGIEGPDGASRERDLAIINISPGERVLAMVTFGNDSAIPSGGTIDVIVQNSMQTDVARCRFYLDYFPPPL